MAPRIPASLFAKSVVSRFCQAPGRFVVALVSIAAASIVVADIAIAHNGAIGIVKERMDSMMDMGKRSKAAAAMFTGKSEYDQSQIVQAAQSFVKHSSTLLDLFPDSEESRTGSKTEALSSIWQNWSEFEMAAARFSQSSILFKEAVETTDDPKILKQAFFKAAKNCRQCHKKFRKAKTDR